MVLSGGLLVEVEKGRVLGRPPEGTLAVDSHGRTLHLDQPPGASVALRAGTTYPCSRPAVEDLGEVSLS